MRILFAVAAILLAVYLALQEYSDEKLAPVMKVAQPISVKAREASTLEVSVEVSEELLPDKSPLPEMGFAPNPENPDELKKTITRNDKVTVYSAAPGSSFSPKEKSAMAALELLERRKDENPEEELLNLKPIDFRDDEAGMLSGRFRDDANDVEFRLSEVEQAANAPAAEISQICLAAPKLNLKSISMSPKHLIRADTTGYGVIRFENGIYARLMWSFENNRVIHGQIIKIERNLPRVLLQFNAPERGVLRAEELKYCK